jgi:hypothetical protein
MSLYPDTILDLRTSIEAYRPGLIDEYQLQESLSRGAGIIVAIEESELRESLLRAEGQIELLRFTVDPGILRGRVMEVISQMENGLDS